MLIDRTFARVTTLLYTALHTEFSKVSVYGKLSMYTRKTLHIYSATTQTHPMQDLDRLRRLKASAAVNTTTQINPVIDCLHTRTFCNRVPIVFCRQPGY